MVSRLLRILLRTLLSAVRMRRELALENLALRQQLAAWKARQPRPRLREMDRIFWIVLSSLWKNWRRSLLWPCFGNDRDPTSPNKVQNRAPRRPVKWRFSFVDRCGTLPKY